MIKGIIFDLFGVNAYRNDEQTLQLFADRTGSTAKHVKQEMEKAGRDALKLGQIRPSTFVTRLNTRLKSNLTVVEVREFWNSTLRVDDEMLVLLKTLKQKYKLFLLSNLNDLDWQAIAKTELPSHFDDLFLSFELHKKKPNPSLFVDVINLIGIQPSELLFIDDQLKNVNAAYTCGMTGIPFTTPQQLASDLSELEI